MISEGADITLVSPDVEPEIKQMAEERRIKWEKRTIEKEDYLNAFFEESIEIIFFFNCPFFPFDTSLFCHLLDFRFNIRTDERYISSLRNHRFQPSESDARATYQMGKTDN